MWSHYANNHTGICIGFDTEVSPFNSTKKVTYNGERPGGPGTYSFDKSAIRSIFLGARITPKNKESLIQAASMLIPHAKVFQTELDNNYFWINKKRLR